MRWESWSQFWAMGGYGVYVWGSMGMTAALLAMEVGQARLMRRQVLRQLQLEHTFATWGDE
jgi:heme exporter protein D